jgi:hypothetical protein
MTILSILTGSNITMHMYEAVRKEVDWEHNHPKGLVFQPAGYDDSGNNIRIADIWESKVELNDLLTNRLIPVMAKGAIPEPKVEVFQINDVSTYQVQRADRVS